MSDEFNKVFKEYTRSLINPVDMEMASQLYNLPSYVSLQELCYVCTPEYWEWMKQSRLASETDGKKDYCGIRVYFEDEYKKINTNFEGLK